MVHVYLHAVRDSSNTRCERAVQQRGIAVQKVVATAGFNTPATTLPSRDVLQAAKSSEIEQRSNESTVGLVF